MSTMTTSNKPKGWFSRRHQSSQAHDEAQTHHQTRQDRQAGAMERAVLYRSGSEQVALLDKRLGKGVGAVRERARLAS